MPEERFDDTFRLHVEEIIYKVLKDRDLTIPEKDAIKDALTDAWELLIARHKKNCDEDMQRKIDRSLLRTKIVVGIVVGVLTIGTVFVQTVLYFKSLHP